MATSTTTRTARRRTASSSSPSQASAPCHDKAKVAIACQGGGSHAAFAAGALIELFQPYYDGTYDLVALSGTSGGGVCAALAWSGLLRPKDGGRIKAVELLTSFWEDLACHDYWDTALNYWGQWVARLPMQMEFSPYLYNPIARQTLETLLRRHMGFDELPVKTLDRVKPHLFLGATDIVNGEGVALSHNLDCDDLIASSAVPPLFRAIHSRGTLLWDGLFSRNPPIREFMDLGEDKPDEIWVIQINPQKRATEPVMMHDILDRRTELAGNLALEQELAMIETINRLLAEFPEMSRKYKAVTVRRIELPIELDHASKLSRDPAHIEMLILEGRRKAKEFFEARSEILTNLRPAL